MNGAAPPPDWEAQAQRALERGARVDAWIPAFLLDSPISRLGFLWATAVGALWGTLWSTGRVERVGELLVFRGMPSWSYRRGGTCVGRCYLTGGNTSAGVLAHEAVHVRQWRRYGMLMPLLYALAGRDALRNRFEIEAGLVRGGYVAARHARTR